MNTISKKIFSSFVSLTTIAWSVGVGTIALPATASAAMPGDLVKASGPAVYYYGADQKRYTFPSESVFKSWYRDFSSVKTISDAELAAIPFGSNNVTMRAGTKLIKITTDPKVYAVTPGGVLHHVGSEAIAISLFGSAWASRVVDVADPFFVNYTVGSEIGSAVHPDGSLVMIGGSKYVIVGGQKRMLSDSAFAANGFNPADVITTSLTYPDGAAVTGREAGLADTVTAAAASSTPVGGAVTASLASDTPAGMTVPKNGSSVYLAKFNLTAGSAAATVTGLKVHRVGVGATTDLANVYIYDASGARLTTGRTVNSTTNMVEFNSLNLMIAAGQTVSVFVTADFGASSSGGQHSVELMDAASVVVSGSSTVSGSFPVRGNVFTVGNANAARLDVTKGTQPTNPNIGAVDAEISNFKLTANTNDIQVRRVTLLQAGSISNSDLSDLKLYQGTTLVASSAALVGDKMVLNFSTPYLLTAGTTKTFSLHAHVAGRAGRTVRTYVEYTTDVYAIDQTYGAGAAVCISNSATGGCSTTGQGSFDGASSSYYVEVTTQGGQLTVAFNGPATTNVAKGSQDVVMYKFSLTSPDNDLEIKNFDFHIVGQTVGGVASRVKGRSGTEYFRDIKVKDVDTGATVMGPTSLSSSVASPATDSGLITLTDSFTLRAGTTRNFAITADLSNTEDADGFFSAGTSTYKVTLGDGSSYIFGSNDVRIVSTGEYLDSSKVVPNTTITGNAFTVKSSSLSVALSSTPSSGTAVKKQAGLPVVGLVFTAGAQSDVLVTAVKLTAVGDYGNNGTMTVGEAYQDLMSCALFNGTTQVGTAQSPDSTLGTMNVTNMNLSIPRGTSVTLTAQCTLASTLGDTVAGDPVAIGIASASDVTAQDGDSNSVTASLSSGVTANASNSATVVQTIMNSGSITIATDNLRSSTILVAGQDVWQNFAQFRATAQNEDMIIDRLTVTSTGDSASFSQVAVAVNGAVKGSDSLSSGSYASKDIDLSQNTITVPKNGSTLIQVWGKLSPTSASSTVSGATSGVARAGAAVSLGLAAGVTSGEWSSDYSSKFNARVTGAASGERVYAAGSNTAGNSFIAHKSVPTVQKQSLSTATLTAGQMDLYKVQVSADSAGSIALKRISFNVSVTTSTGSSMNLTNLRLRRGSSDVALSDVVITDGFGADLEGGSAVTSTANAGGVQQVVSVAFTGEETISGSGNVYTLYGTVGGSVVAGDTVSVSLARTGSSTVTAALGGYLTDSVSTSGSYAGPNIQVGAANGSGTIYPAWFAWSDLSEVPHYSNSSGASVSRDWYNDYLIEDLTASQTLSR